MIELLVDDLRLCNCAQCDCELLGEVQAAEFAAGKYRTIADRPPVVHGRLNERPYCEKCFTARVNLHPTTRGGTRIVKKHLLEDF